MVSFPKFSAQHLPTTPASGNTPLTPILSNPPAQASPLAETKKAALQAEEPICDPNQT